MFNGDGRGINDSKAGFLSRGARLVVVGALIGTMVALVPIGASPAAAAQPAFELPFGCGVTASVDKYSSEFHSAHDIDFNTGAGDTDLNEPILAAAGGTVERPDEPINHQLGRFWINHGGGWRTEYTHMNTLAVGHGDTVTQGQYLGGMGKTGYPTYATAVHLHFTVSLNWEETTATFNTTAGPSTLPHGTSHTSTNCGTPSSIADGDFVKVSGKNTIYRVAGGSPVPLNDCSTLGACPGVKVISQATLDTMRSTPTDGTFIKGDTSATIWRIVGGSPVPLADCSTLGGCTGTIKINTWSVNQLKTAQPTPTDGTFIKGDTSATIWRIVGGSPVPLADCSTLGGCTGTIKINTWSVNQLKTAQPTPTDGTVAKGLPSNTYWRYSKGCAVQVGATTGVVAVNDWSISDTGKSGFFDVPGDHQFCAAIKWTGDLGIDTGYTDGTFKPSNANTRAMLASQFYNYEGKPAFTPPATSPFSDVPTSHPQYKEITWLASTGITTGYADGTFRPTASVNRMSMAAFFYRLAGSPNGADPACTGGTSPFTDVTLAHPFCGEIQWLASTGVTTGYTDGTYRPTSTITRMAMAAFLYRYDAL